MMSSGTQERRTKRAGALADRFRKSCSVETFVWQDEKDFNLDVPLNCQNSVSVELKIKIIFKIIAFSITPVDCRKK